jgi:arginyl-tRNA synthetase
MNENTKLGIDKKIGDLPFDIRKLGVPVPPLPQPSVPIELPPIETMRRPGDYVWTSLRNQLQLLAEQIGTGTEIKLQVGVPSEKIESADFAMACHPLAKIQKQAPNAIAEKIAGELDRSIVPTEIARAKAAGGYVNFELDLGKFGGEVLKQIETSQDRYGEQNIGNGNTVVLDCSSPNVAKHMSVGHLRSTVIGESLARIYKKLGYVAIRDNHLGDWGTQFGMLGEAVKRWGKEVPELQTDPVQGLYKLYVKMHEEIEKEKEALGKGPDGKTPETALEKAGKEWFRKLEEGDPEAHKMWEWALNLSLKEFQRVYDLLGSKFEFYLGESQYIPMNPAVIKALLDAGVAKKAEDGASIVYFDDKKLGADDKGPGKLVIQKSDGASLYATRDLAGLIARTVWFKPEKILYVVGGDQDLYFKQVFAAFDQLVEGNGPKVAHVPFGLVKMGGEKMSTRKGRIVLLEQLLEESVNKARDKIITSKTQTEKKRELSEVDVEQIAKQVGVGAVIYFDLGQERNRTIDLPLKPGTSELDWDKIISFDGNSAPYIQYARTRANSILAKAEAFNLKIDDETEPVFTLPVEKALIKHLGKFHLAIEAAMDGNQPSIISEYTYKIADLFSQFYKQTKIVSETDPEVRNSQLRLTRAAAQVIKNGLYLLGIESPERM